MTTFLENDVRLLYRLLRHKGHATLVDCRTEEGLIDRRLVTDEKEFVEWARAYNGKGNCYCGRNPRNKDDSKVVSHVSAFSFDIDPIYDKAVGATAEQNALALSAARKVVAAYPGGYLCSSGNGALVLYPVASLPTAPGRDLELGTRQLEETLRGTVEQAGTVRLDNTHDLARLIRLVGTANVKGLGSRTSYFLTRYAGTQPVRLVQSIVNAPKAPAKPKTNGSSGEQPWVSELLKGVGDGKKHYALTRLCGYFLPRLPLDVVLQMMQEWNKRNQTPAKPENIEKTVCDLHKRLKDGAYTSKFTPPSEPNEVLIHSPKTSMDRFNTWLAKQHETSEFPTGIQAVDEKARVRRGQITLLVARNKLGKSTMATDWARSFNRAGKRVLFLPTEMSFEEVWVRYYAGELKIPAAKIQDRRLDVSEATAIAEYSRSRFQDADFFICDQSVLNIGIVSQMVEQVAPDIIILDYFQYTETPTDNRATDLAKFARAMKSLAKEKDIAVVMTAQAHEKRDYKTGQIFRSNCMDIKESKGLIDTASVIMVLNWADEGLEDTGQELAPIELEVERNRFGPRCKTLLRMDRSIPTFYATDTISAA